GRGAEGEGEGGGGGGRAAGGREQRGGAAGRRGRGSLRKLGRGCHHRGGDRDDDATADRGDRESEAARERTRIPRDPGTQGDGGLHPPAARGARAGQFHAPQTVQGDMIGRLAARFEDPRQRARLLRLLWVISTGFTLFGFGVIFYRIFFPR